MTPGKDGKMTRRVVVTGVGAVCPLGVGAEALWEACAEGRSGVSTLTHFPGEGFLTDQVGEVRDFDAKLFVEKRKSLKLMNSSIKYAVASARMALEHGGCELSGEDDFRFGVFMGARVMPSEFSELEGSVFCALDENRRFTSRNYGEGARSVLFPLSMLKNLPNMAAAHIAINHRALGSNDTTTAGAVSGLASLVEGADAIRRGELDRALVGATDSLVDPVNLATLSCRGIVSPTGSPRPFDAERDGCVLGEGAALLYLEEREGAVARGATILAELLAEAETFDPSLLDERLETAGEVQAPARVLESLDGARPDYVLGAACGIRRADEAEARCIAAAVGMEVPVGTILGLTGFAGAASSALTLAAAIGVLVRGRPYPAWGCKTVADDLACRILPEGTQEPRPRRVLVSAFSLTGQRGAVVFEGGKQ